MGPRAPPLADPELFAVDTSGSTSIRNAVLTEYNQGGVSRRRKGATRPLMAAQIIADRNAATRPALNHSEGRIAKRKREREAGISKELKKKLDGLSRRQPRGGGLWNVMATEPLDEVSHAARESGTYDAWTVDVVEEAKRAALPEDIREAVSVKRPRVPPSLRRHDRLPSSSRPLPISQPHPGTSYNPSQDEHQELLRTALDKAEVEEADLEADRAAAARINAVRAQDRGRELWEHAEMDVDKRSHASGVSEGAGDNADDGDAALSKNPPKRKTQKEKRRAAQNRRTEAVIREQKQRANAERQAIAALPGNARAARRALVLKEAKQLGRESARLSALAQRGLAGKRVGSGVAPIASLDYQLSDDLAEGLRGLKPEGNLWRDWSGSATRRGMMEASRRKAGLQRKAKGRSLKEVEKATWRHWER